MMRRIYLNDGWKFTKEFSEELLKEDCNEELLTSVRLPHTVQETPFSYFDESMYQMISGYRRMIRIPEEWRGKRLLLTFEGVAHDSVVYCNGEAVGEHHCGYTAFTVDISTAVRYGQDNLLVVKVDSRESLNIPPFGYVIDYMTFGGIYRDVRLDVKETDYISDVFHYCEFGENLAVSLISKYEINCMDDRRDKLSLKLYLTEQDGKERFLGRSEIAEKIQKTGDTVITVLRTEVEKIALWSPENPILYTLVSRLYQGETLRDERRIPFGFRKAEFLPDGFYLNNKKVKICGLNRHQSYPYVGYAMPRSIQELDAVILKQELGVNAVRTSHYPQSHYFINKCDELGLLVFTEIPGWQHIGDENWKKQAVQNTADMVKQYRNHPSIILWGVRINESKDDDAFYQKTNETARLLDPSRQTGGVRAHKRSSLLEDVYTYNDFLHDGSNRGCETKKNVTSDRNKGYLISEYNGHMFPTKSYDNEELRREHAIRHAAVLNAVAGEEDIAGSFGWCMFDYNTHKDFGSGDRICYHGVMDMFRNSKDAAWIYACRREQDTVLALSSTMDIGEHPGCNRGTTWIYSNADSVRMYKNDRFMKEYFPGDSPFRNLKYGPIPLNDFIGNALEENEDFKPAQAKGVKDALNAAALYGLGKLPKRIYLTALKLILVYHMKPVEAVALYNKYIGDWGGTSTIYRFEAIKDGKVVKTITKEPAKEANLLCTADHVTLVEQNSYDVALVRIRAVDQNGNTLPYFQEPVILETFGDIELIGPACISLKGGMGGTYVKSIGKSGKGKLNIKSNQTEVCHISFTVVISGADEE